MLQFLAEWIDVLECPNYHGPYLRLLDMRWIFPLQPLSKQVADWLALLSAEERRDACAQIQVHGHQSITIARFEERVREIISKKDVKWIEAG
jgi:hypothetical protein